MTALTRIVLVLITGLFAHMSSAQKKCNAEELFRKNKPLLENYQFIKFFPIETSKQVDKVQYTYVLNRDTKYRIVIVDNGVDGEKMIVTVRDPNKKVMASNKDKQKRTYVNKVDFVCPTTGVYFIEASFEDERKDCGLNILGFQK